MVDRLGTTKVEQMAEQWEQWTVGCLAGSLELGLVDSSECKKAVLSEHSMALNLEIAKAQLTEAMTVLPSDFRWVEQTVSTRAGQKAARKVAEWEKTKAKMTVGSWDVMTVGRKVVLWATLLANMWGSLMAMMSVEKLAKLMAEKSADMMAK